jgi:serine/threonine-protein kinase
MLQPRDRFDRYVVEGVLGEGGMGRVYRARDEKLRRSVALKVLRAESEAASARLLHEARAAAALEHANTIAIYDVAEADGVPFIAMELVVGRSLRTFVGDVAVPVTTRVRWLADVARALAAAHDRGILHRDVKPENVIVRHDGVVKVLDFGIARSLEAPVDEEPGGRDDDLDELAVRVVGTWTKSGLLGTPRYMAPEQLQGERLDARADQFAWGVLAYELLTGRSPWEDDGETVGLKLVASILGHAPPPEEPLARAAPRNVVATVSRALAKRPCDRFASMASLLDLLEGSAGGTAATAATVDMEASGVRSLRASRLRPRAPGITVHGAFVNAILDGFGPFRPLAWKYVVSLGLAHGGAIDADAWVSQEKWFDVFNAIIDEVGGPIIFNIGQQIPARAPVWPDTTGIEGALRTLDIAYHMNHHKDGRPMYDPATGAFVDGIGNYAASRTGDEKVITVACDNPYPCELDHGIITAITRRYEATARVDHAPLGCRTIGAAACTYSVTWD